MKLLAFLLIFIAAGCDNFPHSREWKQLDENEKRTKAAVSNWIKKHALYPDSYEPISFEEYSESYATEAGKRIPNSEDYRIKHKHFIKGKDNKTITFEGYFVLNHSFSLSAIGTKTGNSFTITYPGLLKVWIEKFGKE